MRAVALVGAQAGSEGKGAVAERLAADFDVHVRTGGPNAGHTFYYEGKKFVARGLPVGWINPNARLVIGAGAVLDWRLLVQEIEEAEMRSNRPAGQVRRRVKIHPSATVITKEQHAKEGGVEGRGHQAIGSTGEGVGMARIARVNRRSFLRGPEFVHVQARDVDEIADMVSETVYDVGDQILLEGTQGSKLSLTHGEWPYTTSADTNAAQLLADAGLSPGCFHKTILVARTFPIRVAGQSGPLPRETTWEDIGQPEERTTVTQKVRRVGRWYLPWVMDAIRLNDPCELVITFLDYLFPETEGMLRWENMPAEVRGWLSEVERQTGVQVVGVGTGPRTMAFRESFLP